MEARREIAYFLIEHPFKDERVIVFDEDKILTTLNQFKEGIKIGRTLYASKREDWQRDKLLATERSLAEKYESALEGLRGWAFLSFFGGLTLSYLFFKPLFRLGYLPLISFLTRNFKTVTPEIANIYADVGAQLAAPIIGMILGFLPLILSGVAMYNALKKARKHKEHAELMRDLKRCELEIVEEESLSSFCKDSKDLIEKTREQAENLRKTRVRHEKIELCREIRDHLEKLIIVTKLYELDKVNEHYHRLHDSFYNLEYRLKNPRFWRNDEKYMRELLGDLK